jgi:ribosomal protein L30
MAKLRVTYKKSAIGYSKDQKDTVRSLGLRKLNSSAVHNDTPAIRGMAFKVRHLVALEEIADEVSAKPAQAHQTVATPTPVAAGAEPAKQDDLTILEGIGPKIASVLQAAGITTFAQLAATDVARLEEILQSADLRLADPGTWPEQAALAAAGKQEELQQLMGQLKGGRRS